MYLNEHLLYDSTQQQNTHKLVYSEYWSNHNIKKILIKIARVKVKHFQYLKDDRQHMTNITCIQHIATQEKSYNHLSDSDYLNKKKIHVL